MKKCFCMLMVLFCLSSTIFAFCGCEKNVKVGCRYEINVEYNPENETLAGTSKCTFENWTDGAISVLKFQLYPNAYKKDALYKPIAQGKEESAYYDGESYGEMVISSVNNAKSWEVMGDDGNILFVYLQNELFPNEKVTLDIAFLLKVAKVNHRTGITPHTVNFGNFFPILCGIKNGGFYELNYYSTGDPFYSDCADYKVTVTLPKGYEVATSGEVVSERVLESKTKYTFTAEKVRDFAFVVARDYKVIQQEITGNTLYYYYYQDEQPEKTLEIMVEAFDFFEKQFGDYPYRSYALAQTKLCENGFEFPRLSLLADHLKQEEKPLEIAHEIAHQWWGMCVGSDQTEQAWQDEGLAQYSAILFLDAFEKYGLNKETATMQALKEYRDYYDVYGSVLGRTDTKMIRHLKDFIGDYEYRCIAYDKAVVMLNTLEKSIGEEKFIKGLRKYYKENQYKTVTYDHLIGCYEKVGADVRGFFESFLYGKAIL